MLSPDPGTEKLDVYYFSEPKFYSAMIDTLVIKEEWRRLIKALAKNYPNDVDPGSKTAHKEWSADYVAGKGEGKIFLLHRKPGVGKTYIAGTLYKETRTKIEMD